MRRRYLEVAELVSGFLFRFLYDRDEPSRLHIEKRWDVLPEQAISAFFDPTADTAWIDEKRCYETRTRDHILVWLWQDDARTQVMVITCVRLEGNDQW